MTEQEQQKHNDDIDLLTDIMKRHNIKIVYINRDKTSTEFTYFDDIKE